MAEQFLDFRQISQAVHFKNFLDWLQIPYEETRNGELKGRTEDFHFIVNPAKNLFFSPSDKDIKGSVINFLSNLEGIGLRESAKRIKKAFLEKEKEREREIPELTLGYHPFLGNNNISPERAKEYECGFCGQRSIMAGKIAFKVREMDGTVAGYVGFNMKDETWFFPKGFKRSMIYNLHRFEKGSDLKLYPGATEAVANDGVSTLGLSMTDEQESLLIGHGGKITVCHYPHPENIINRLSAHCYVKVEQ